MIAWSFRNKQNLLWTNTIDCKRAVSGALFNCQQLFVPFPMIAYNSADNFYTISVLIKLLQWYMTHAFHELLRVTHENYYWLLSHHTVLLDLEVKVYIIRYFYFFTNHFHIIGHFHIKKLNKVLSHQEWNPHAFAMWPLALLFYTLPKSFFSQRFQISCILSERKVEKKPRNKLTV